MNVIDWILHLDKYLTLLIDKLGFWSYAILFCVIFMETGFVVTPFLPGDSLLFAAGALSVNTGGNGGFNIFILFGSLSVAAFLGDTVNYWIGHFIGPKAFTSKSKFLKKEYMDKAQQFYEKHGGKAIFLARFVPIVRTFAPFVAGIGKMEYKKFLTYNLTGGITWVAIFLFAGHFFGNIPFIKENFHFVAIVIVLISVVPIVIEVIKAKLEKKQNEKKK